MNRALTSSALAVIAVGGGAVGTVMAAGLSSGSLDASNLLPFAVGGVSGVLSAGTAAIGMGFRNRDMVQQFDRERHAARHDALTGLLNRAEIHRQLAGSLVEAARDKTVVGVLFLDLNRFKEVNDTLGHDAGDELLKVVAGRLRATIRSTDLVARLGGDEFVVVCRDLLVADSVLNVASQIQRRFREPVSLGEAMHEVGASIGIAIAAPGDERSPEELLRDADTAMYQAKRERAPFRVYDDATRFQQMNRLAVERALAEGVEGNQLVLFYQPVVDVVDQALVGFEALVRWRHPEWGLVEPATFLPIADSVGLMAPIGRFVLREAGAQMAVWSHTTPEARRLTVSINLAEQQLTDPNLPTELAELLDWLGLDPGQLVIEVSEGLLARHIEELDVLRQLREMGLPIALDGFGTGGLALCHTGGFDLVSTIKIDRSFARSLNDDRSTRAAVEAIVAMARSLGLDIVAEGVEDIEQMAFLRSLGVRRMQGYLFRAPDFAELVDPGAWFSRSSDQFEDAVGLVPSPSGAGPRSR